MFVASVAAGYVEFGVMYKPLPSRIVMLIGCAWNQRKVCALNIIEDDESASLFWFDFSVL